MRKLLYFFPILVIFIALIGCGDEGSSSFDGKLVVDPISTGGVAYPYDVEAGEVFKFSTPSNGVWCWDEPNLEHSCGTADGDPDYELSGEYLYNDYPVGSLIGRVNNSEFLIGAEGEVSMPESGTLYLMINDYAGQHNDNSGSITVTIEKVE